MTRTADRPGGRARRVQGWMMFDWASQPFYTLCLTFLFGPYLTGVLADAWAGPLGAAAADARAQQVWSWTQTGIGVAIALTAPLLGAVADRSGRRMRWIWVFSALYVVGATGLWWMMPDGSGLLPALAAFALAMIGAEFATVFTNAMLPDLARRAEIGRISGRAYALGYAGGVAALFLMLGLFADGPEGTTLLGRAPALGLDGAAREGTRFVGPFTALWYAVFMVSFFVWVRDPATAPAGRPSLRQAWGDVAAMLRTLPGRPSLAAWLAGSMLYRDGLVALYAFGGVYARLVLGWETTQIELFGILSAVTAAVASWVGGGLDARHGPKPVIAGCVWILAGVVAALCAMSRDMVFGMSVGPDSLAPDVLFYAFGCLIGGAGGVLQASSRTMMVRHTDPGRPTEAFGLYALSGKATAFLAPLCIGLATWATGSARLGIFPVALLFIAGLILLRWVDPEGDR